MDRINPSYYRSNENGIECIQITRHHCFAIGNAIKYLWRQGLKEEVGVSDKAKEDCKKAIWYIKDYVENTYFVPDYFFESELHPSGINASLVVCDKNMPIGQAIKYLMFFGRHGDVPQESSKEMLQSAMELIEEYIA